MTIIPIGKRQTELAVKAIEAKLNYWDQQVRVSIPKLVDEARETASFLGAQGEDHSRLVNAMLMRIVPRYAPAELIEEIAIVALERENKR